MSLKTISGNFFRPMLVTSMATLLLLQVALLPCLSQESSSPSDIDTSLQGKATLTAVGPVRMPEGVALLKGTSITVLSNANDPVAEAELTGFLLNVHRVTSTDGQKVIEGLAVFAGGNSITALDDKTNSNEAVQLMSGTNFVGHVESVDATKVRITTPQGSRDIKISDVADMASPRAFEVSVPATAIAIAATSTASSASTSTPISSSSSSSASTATSSEQALPEIKFSPTKNVSAHPMAIVRATMYENSVSKHPIRRRAFVTAASVAGLFFCYAIPAAVALSTKHIGGFKGDL